ncbi:ABC transporter ATP-binding protein [Abiotrophia defectiva]
MLEVKHLVKHFGDLCAVNDVSFAVQPGSIMGIIGQNGSGKTTIFRMILNFLNLEPGASIEWQGQPMSNQVYDTVGYLPEERGLYDKMTIEDQIVFFAELRGMKKAQVLEKIDYWMEKFDVRGKRSDKIKSLSKGNQQKVQLIATLIHEPKLMILDEPFSGLDPVNADLLKQGILELKAKGSSIIFSSHNMNNVEEICDHLVMIHYGKQVLSGTVDEVKESFGRTRIFLESPDWNQAQLQALPGVEKVRHLSGHRYHLILSEESAGHAIFDAVTQGKYIAQFSQQPPTLDEIFKLKVEVSDHE